jgi:AcrR family transcriptional regulator
MARAARVAAPVVDLRRALIDAAARILADEGPKGLSVRRVAQDVGASTMVVYTHLGDKDGMIDAVLEHAFGEFADTLGAVSDPDPWVHLRALGYAYRSFAKANPAAYRLMFGRPTPTGRMPASGQRGFAALTTAIGRVMAALDRPARMIEPYAMCTWSSIHGIVSLELAGGCPPADVESLFERVLDFIEAGLRG